MKKHHRDAYTTIRTSSGGPSIASVPLFGVAGARSSFDLSVCG